MTIEELKEYIVDYEAGDVAILDRQGELEKVGEWNPVMDMNDEPTTLHIFSSTGVVPELSKLDGEHFFTAGNN